MIFVLYFSSIAQSSQEIQLIVKSEISQKEKIHYLDSLFSVWGQKKTDSLNYLYQKYAYWLYDEGEKEKAILYEKKALYSTLSLEKPDTLFAQKSALYLGFYYRMNGQFKQSIDSYHQTIDLEGKNRYFNSAFNQLGHTYYLIKDYYKAHLYYKASLENIKSNKLSLFKVQTYYKTAYNLMHLRTRGDFSKGLYYAHIADSLSLKIPIPPLLQYDIKACIATLYNKNETLNIPLSKAYYIEALKIAETLNDTSLIQNIYIDLGNLYHTTDLNTALNYNQKALAYTSKNDTLPYFNIIGNIGFAYSYFGEYKKGISYTLRALYHLTNEDFKNFNIDRITMFVNSSYQKQLFINFSILGEAYLRYYEETKKPEYLEKSIAYFEIADQLIDLLKINSSEFKSRLFWQKESADIYGKAIRTCFLNKDFDKAFYFMEKSKVLLLQEDLAQQDYIQSLALPSKILEKEQHLQKEIFRKEQLLKSNISGAEVYESIIEAKLKLDILRDSLQLSNRSNFEPQIVSLEEAQQNLKEDEVFVNYHISRDDGYGVYSNNNRGYVLISTSTRHHFFEINNTFALEEDVLELLESIRKPFSTPEEITTYAKRSHTIYQHLFPSQEIQKLLKGKKIIISPDDFLSFLPFEALSTSSEQSNYLINETEVRYVYSNSFVKNIARPETTKDVAFLGVAPSSFENQQLAPLYNSTSELQSLNAYYTGITLTDEQSTKTSFIAALDQYDLIHLATHADAQDSISPWIAFKDEKINLEELYTTKNNAALVFLSGCKTTLGKREAGEGVMSLARGFFYGGAQSVISTLWNIDDRSTTYITDAFYKNLSKGQTKYPSTTSSKTSLS